MTNTVKFDGRPVWAEVSLGALTGNLRGLILGLALSYVSGYEGSALVPLAALAILLIVLMVRPGGLFSATQERRV